MWNDGGMIVKGVHHHRYITLTINTLHTKHTEMIVKLKKHIIYGGQCMPGIKRRIYAYDFLVGKDRICQVTPTLTRKSKI